MHIEQKIETRTSPESLWTLLTEPEQVKRWIPELISDEPITPGPEGVGMKTRMRLKEGSKVVEYGSEITAFDREDYLELRLTGGSLGAGPMVVGYRLLPGDQGTGLHYTSTWQPYGLILRLLSPLITFMAKKNTRAQLRRLQKLADA